jgi:hypothetical protein
MGARDAIAKLLTGIKAFHSSPHDFERFDLSKIGSGEGAQAYGHGLYFAENPAISGQGGQYWNQFTKRFEGPEYLAADKLRKAGFDREAAIALAQKDLDAVTEAFKTGTHPPGLVGQHDPYTLENITKNMMYDRQSQLDLLQSGKPVGPRTYEVNINADPAQMLDWDKPIAQQKAYEALQKHWDDKIGDPEIIAQRMGIAPTSPGGRLYSGIGGLTQDAQKSTGMLQDAGIPGIKYLDEGSRNLGGVEDFIAQHGGRDNALAFANDRLAAAKARGSTEVFDWEKNIKDIQTPITRNYVVFDPSNIDIMKKYGVVGAPAGTLAMGEAYDQSQYQPPDEPLR